MDIEINQRPVQWPEEGTLAELLSSQGFTPPFAVAINTRFVPRSAYDQIRLQAGDRAADAAASAAVLPLQIAGLPGLQHLPVAPQESPPGVARRQVVQRRGRDGAESVADGGHPDLLVVAAAHLPVVGFLQPGQDPSPRRLPCIGATLLIERFLGLMGARGTGPWGQRVG